MANIVIKADYDIDCDVKQVEKGTSLRDKKRIQLHNFGVEERAAREMAGCMLTIASELANSAAYSGSKYIEKMALELESKIKGVVVKYGY